MGELGSIVDEVEGADTAAPTAPAAEPDAALRPTVVLADGPPGSFGDFYADHYAGLVRLAALLSGSVDTAPDLVQDCFVGLHGRWTSVREPLPYIRRSVVHACASHHRRSAVVRRNPLPVPPAVELGADELEDALARLPVIYRLPVVLHDALGWTCVDIAQSMDVSLPAAKQRLRRGRMMLVSALASTDGRREASLAQPMRCWQARRHVSSYLDGELDEATKAMVEGHLADCPTCPPLYTSLVGIRATMGELRDADAVVEDAIASRIHERLSQERP